MNLQELLKTRTYKTYPTDKCTIHKEYIKIYDELFAEYKDKKINIFEVGYGYGGSIKLWEDYFIEANIICCDIKFNEKHNLALNRTTKLKKPIKTVTETEFAGTPITIAIDDGSHRLQDQLHFVKVIYPQLTSPGLLIIEDIQNITEDLPHFKSLNLPFKMYDLRTEKSPRYDNILLVFTK